MLRRSSNALPWVGSSARHLAGKEAHDRMRAHKLAREERGVSRGARCCGAAAGRLLPAATIPGGNSHRRRSRSSSRRRSRGRAGSWPPWGPPSSRAPSSRWRAATDRRARSSAHTRRARRRCRSSRASRRSSRPGSPSCQWRSGGYTRAAAASRPPCTRAQTQAQCRGSACARRPRGATPGCAEHAR